MYRNKERKAGKWTENRKEKVEKTRGTITAVISAS